MNDDPRATRRDALIVAATALAARIAVLVWASSRFPPTADGTFYHTIATRIAQGHGYTWLWPDGVVTYAAHYPVGYPGLIGAAYAIFGAKPLVAMSVNALIGVAGASATHALAVRATSRRAALVVGMVAALHVGLLAYTPALMTEGITAALWAVAAWSAMRSREAGGRSSIAWLTATGVVLAISTLVRPQSILIAPWLGWWAMAPGVGWLRRLQRAAGVTLVAAVLCAPWAVRNQVRMGQAGLSFNGGWNLLIGATPSARGSWAPLEVPEPCREVFDEAKKDDCFGREARRWIGQNPGSWVSLVPAKMAVTFDYCGAPGWYLHAANPQAFPHSWKVALGAVETITERVVLGAALVGLGLAKGPRRRVRLALSAVALLHLLTQHAWIGYLALVPIIALFGSALASAAFALPTAAGVMALTALTHAVFFGAGRYGLPVMPFVTALAGGLIARLPSSAAPAPAQRGARPEPPATPRPS